MLILFTSCARTSNQAETVSRTLDVDSIHRKNLTILNIPQTSIKWIAMNRDLAHQHRTRHRLRRVKMAANQGHALNRLIRTHRLAATIHHHHKTTR